MFQKTAHTIAANLDDQADFLGHIGGDDFIVVFKSGDWRERCEHILRHCARKVTQFYSEAKQRAGNWFFVSRRRGPNLTSAGEDPAA